jgi:hypothetical protein
MKARGDVRAEETETGIGKLFAMADRRENFALTHSDVNSYSDRMLVFEFKEIQGDDVK